MHDSLKDRWLILALAFYAWMLVVWPLALGLPVTIEDGFYYLKIAQNVVAGAGSTFDGLHPTNGYHPLWLLCLLAVTALAASPGQVLLLSSLLQSLMVVVTVVLVYRASRTVSGRIGAFSAVLLWIQLGHRSWLDGTAKPLPLEDRARPGPRISSLVLNDDREAIGETKAEQADKGRENRAMEVDRESRLEMKLGILDHCCRQSQRRLPGSGNRREAVRNEVILNTLDLEGGFLVKTLVDIDFEPLAAE